MHDRRVILSSSRTHNRKFSPRTAAVAGSALAVAAIASGAAVSATTGAHPTGAVTTTAAAQLLAATHADHPRVSAALKQSKSQAATYTVKPGDSLSAITGRLFGHSELWPRFYATNITVVGAYPDRIMPGERLKVALAPHGATGQQIAVQQAPAAAQPVAAAAAVPQAPAVSYAAGAAPGGSFGACVRARESGGNYQAYNSGGYYGAYQFSASTWAAYGGNPADYGHASAAEQDQVFANAIAQGGQSNWAPYDGC